MLQKLGLELCENCSTAVDEKFWEAHKGLCEKCYTVYQNYQSLKKDNL